MTSGVSGRPALLLVGDTLHIGGTEGQFTELACRLDRARWDLDLACVRPEGPLLKPLEAAGLRPWRCGPASFKSPLLLGAIGALARRIKTRGIDVLHSFGFYSNVLALPAARLAGVPPGNAPALAQAIVRLGEDRALAAGLGERARAHAHRDFGMDRMVARVEDLYARSLVGSSRQPT